MDFIFTKDSEFINQDNYWFAELSDGRIIYEDNMSNLSSTWDRLKNFLSINNSIFVKKFGLHFLNRDIIMPPENININGFFFCKRNMGLLGVSNFYFKGIGYVKDDIAYVHWINVDNGSFSQETIDVTSDDIRVILFNEKISFDKHA